MGGVFFKDYASSIIINQSKDVVQYRLIRFEDVKVEEKIHISGQVQVQGGNPKVEVGGTYDLTLKTNKESNAYITVHPGCQSRINLKSCDKVPIKSRLIISINGCKQHTQLHSGFQAFRVNSESKLEKLDLEQSVLFYEKKMKEKGYVDVTIKEGLKKELQSYFGKEQLEELKKNNFELYERIVGILPALKGK